MKKLEIYNKQFKCPHLFREDLEEIECIILKELKPETFYISTDTVEYNSLNELVDHEVAVKNLTLHAYKPFLSIYFTKNSAWINSTEQDIKIVGACEKIYTVVLKCERRKTYLMLKFIRWLSPIFVLSTYALAILYILNSKNTIATFLFICGIFFSLLFISTFHINFPSKVELTSKKDRSSFLKKYKDQIFIGIINSVISGVIGGIIGFFVSKSLK